MSHRRVGIVGAAERLLCDFRCLGVLDRRKSVCRFIGRERTVSSTCVVLDVVLPEQIVVMAGASDLELVAALYGYQAADSWLASRSEDVFVIPIGF